MPELDDIIKRAQKGEKEAFEAIYREFEGLVYNTAYYMTKNSDDACDIAQEVFIKVYKALPNFRGDCKFSSWIYRICVNTVNDHLRRSSRHKTVSLSVYDEDKDEDSQLDIPDENEENSPEAAMDKKIASETIRDAICSLPDDMKQIIILRDIEGYSYEELCGMLGLKEGTVKSRINRARTILRDKLKSFRG